VSVIPAGLVTLSLMEWRERLRRVTAEVKDRLSIVSELVSRGITGLVEYMAEPGVAGNLLEKEADRTAHTTERM
jgi:hypothetical protein